MTLNKLLLVGLATTSMALPTIVRAQHLSVEIGDRPYYTHGARYWEGEREMIWVPGHWSSHGHHWIHGHYVRGEHHRHDGAGYRDEAREIHDERRY